MNIAIIDSGGANIASLRYALERLGTPGLLTRDPAEIRAADRVLLPGVGAAADAMTRLSRLGLVGVIRTLTAPVLGICLGMQLLFDRSEEGPADCLGLVAGTVRALPRAPGLPVPHMGWNRVIARAAGPLLDGIDDGAHFYFVHSYAADPGDHTRAVTDYGRDIAAVVSRGNFHGTQFHPERSGPAGARLLRNFLALAP